jgi:hypothetical protein
VERTQIINPDWDFSKMGIGGLDTEFNAIFRSVKINIHNFFTQVNADPEDFFTDKEYGRTRVLILAFYWYFLLKYSKAFPHDLEKV